MNRALVARGNLTLLVDPVGPARIDDAARAGPLLWVLGDGRLRRHRLLRGRPECRRPARHPAPGNAAYGLHRDRDPAMAQVGRLGPARWRQRVGYGDRAHVEGAFSASKRTTGWRTNARSFAGVAAEVTTRVNRDNRWRAQELAA